MKLIYRGNIYESTPRSIPMNITPTAVNWRYQPLQNEIFENNSCPVISFPRPRAINCRYQASAWV